MLYLSNFLHVFFKLIFFTYVKTCLPELCPPYTFVWKRKFVIRYLVLGRSFYFPTKYLNSLEL
jgi:hypothetical protein